MAAEETGGIESSGDLESFVMKSEMPRGELLFIGSKLSVTVLNYTTSDGFIIRTEAVLV
jgi:hypothetical protein